MKTSFYFILWLIVFPLLGMLNIPFVDNNSFIFAVVIVWTLSYTINRLMPDIIAYNEALEAVPILEDVYQGRVKEFKDSLTRMLIVDGITALYLTGTTFGLILLALAGHIDVFALVIFGIFSYGAITRSHKLFSALSELKQNPTPEQCAEIAEESLNLNYSEYREERMFSSLREMFADRPKHFKTFNILSIIFACIAPLMGLALMIAVTSEVMNNGWSLTSATFDIVTFLYGTMAVYFGVKDFFSSYRVLKTSTSLSCKDADPAV